MRKLRPMKKIVFLLIAIILYFGYLEIWGGRDFAQISIAIEKYNYSDDFQSLKTDLYLIYSGGKVNTGGLATAKMADRIYYKWVDENGVLHHSERRPNVEKYETIRMGDLSIEIQKGLSQEEIDKTLNKTK